MSVQQAYGFLERFQKCSSQTQKLSGRIHVAPRGIPGQPPEPSASRVELRFVKTCWHSSHRNSQDTLNQERKDEKKGCKGPKINLEREIKGLGEC